MRGIKLRNEGDYRRAVEIEAELIEQTGYRPPTKQEYVSYPVAELVDGVMARLDKEGINYKVEQNSPPRSDRPNPAL